MSPLCVPVVYTWERTEHNPPTAVNAPQSARGYRVGDANRNRAADLLKEAHAAGYLTLEETDERLGTGLAARTRGEPDRPVADLPPEWPASQERDQRSAGPPPRQRPPCRRRLPGWWRCEICRAPLCGDCADNLPYGVRWTGPRASASSA